MELDGNSNLLSGRRPGAPKPFQDQRNLFGNVFERLLWPDVCIRKQCRSTGRLRLEHDIDVRWRSESCGGYLRGDHTNQSLASTNDARGTLLLTQQFLKLGAKGIK